MIAVEQIAHREDRGAGVLTTTGGAQVKLYRGPVEIYGSGTDFSVMTLENNAVSQPNRSGITGDDGPLDLTTPIPGFTPRHKGPRWNFQHYETTLAAAVSGAGGTFSIAYADVRDTRANIGGVDDGAPTSQAYWQATAATDTRHRVRINGSNATTFHADTGDISVTFGASQITITNTSGTDWQAGDNLRLRLDRSSRLPGFDAQYNSQDQVVPLARPLAESPALGTGGAGVRAHDDLLLQPRPASGGDRGALLCT